MKASFDLDSMMDKLIGFESEREWGKFHSIKNLCIAVSVESGELLEVIQWEDEQDLINVSDEVKRELSEEVADVLINSLMLCKKLGVNPLEAIERKIELNRVKYPVSQFKGRYKKK